MVKLFSCKCMPCEICKRLTEQDGGVTGAVAPVERVGGNGAAIVAEGETSPLS